MAINLIDILILLDLVGLICHTMDLISNWLSINIMSVLSQNSNFKILIIRLLIYNITILVNNCITVMIVLDTKLQ